MKSKKALSVFFLILFIIGLLLCSNILAIAHSGGTDSNGGHYDRQNEGYHYHHGYPEHEHPDGVCPYKNKTDITKKKPNIVIKIIGCIIGALFLGYLFACIPTGVILLVFLFFFKKGKGYDLGWKIFKWLSIIFAIIISCILFYGFWNS